MCSCKHRKFDVHNPTHYKRTNSITYQNANVVELKVFLDLIQGDHWRMGENLTLTICCFLSENKFCVFIFCVCSVVKTENSKASENVNVVTRMQQRELGTSIISSLLTHVGLSVEERHACVGAVNDHVTPACRARNTCRIGGLTMN
jgi:hypothetical protein